MILITVPVPKRAKPIGSQVSAFAFHLGKRENKIPVRFFSHDLGAYRGKTLVCRAEVTSAQNADGKLIELIELRPANAKRPTHVPVREGGKIKLSMLAN